MKHLRLLRLALFWAGYLLLVSPLFLGSAAHAQVVGSDWEVTSVERIQEDYFHMCTIPTTEQVSVTQVDPYFPSPDPGVKQETEATVQFDITYDFEGFDEMKAAFEEAANRWSSHIRSSTPITIDVSLESLGGKTLATARMAPRFLIQFRDAKDQEREFIFPPALASYLTARNLEPEESHFSISINPDQNWYIGAGSPGAGEYDFISVMMHEIGHGLGIFGSMDVQNGRGIWPGSEDDVGHPPYIYDGFSVDEAGTLLVNTDAYPNPSAHLRDVLEGGVGSVFFTGEQTNRAAPTGPAVLYTPEVWNFGSSYSHLDQETYPAGDQNSLMTPRFAQQEVVRSPGPLACGMMADMGWGMGPGCFELLGGSIVAFEAVITDKGLRVHWVADGADDTINQFVLETLHLDAPPARRQYETLVTLDANAFDSQTNNRRTYQLDLSDLSPGRHALRLRALQADGTEVEVSPAQQLTVPLQEETYHISGVYPNPVSGQARAEVTVTEEEVVTMQVIDSSGRMVLVQRQRLVPNIPAAFTWDASGLAGGTYFLYFTGESFTETRSAVVVH